MKNLMLIFLLILFQSCTFSDEDNQGIYSEVTSYLECWDSTLQSSGGVGNALGISGGDIYLGEGKYNTSGVLYAGSDGDSLYLSKYNSCGNLDWQTLLPNNVHGGSLRDLNLGSDKNILVLFQITQQFELMKYNSSGSRIWTSTTSHTIDAMRQMTIDSNNNIYIVGGVGDMNANPSYGENVGDQSNWSNKDFYIVKYNENGVKQWIHQWGSGFTLTSNQNMDSAISVTVDDSNNVYVVGTTNGCPSGLTCGGGSEDVILLKLDSDGNKLWNKVFGDGSSDSVLRITYHNGYIYFWGATDRISGYSWALTKLDTDGNQIWDRGVTVTGYPLVMTSDNRQGGEMIFDSENNIILSGTLYNSINNNSLWISKFDTDGAMLFEKVISSGSNDELRDISIDSENNIFITGYTDGDFGTRKNSGTSDMFVMKLNSNGEVQ